MHTDAMKSAARRFQPKNPWTEEEETRLRTEVAEKHSVEHIAILHDRTPGAIVSRMKRLGLSIDQSV